MATRGFVNNGEIMFPVHNDEGHLRTLREIEADLIRLAIPYYGGNCSLVAERLGIGRSSLYRKMREIGIIPPN